jgi:hypothetical protein
MALLLAKERVELPLELAKYRVSAPALAGELSCPLAHARADVLTLRKFQDGI